MRDLDDPGVQETAQRMGISPQEAATADYIGDGVYVTQDGYHTWLRTLEGHRIALEHGLAEKVLCYDRAWRQG